MIAVATSTIRQPVVSTWHDMNQAAPTTQQTVYMCINCQSVYKAQLATLSQDSCMKSEHLYWLKLVLLCKNPVTLNNASDYRTAIGLLG